MNKTGIITIIVILALLIIGVVAFSNSNDNAEENINVLMPGTDNTNTGTSTVGTTSPNTTGTVGATTSVNVGTQATKTFTVVGDNFKFSPTTMTVNKGDRVVVTFINKGGTHDWKIDEFNAATKIIQGGQQETISFTADKSGSFEYYCSVGQHRQMGMKGTLIVK
jgi:plastocyanin